MTIINADLVTLKALEHINQASKDLTAAQPKEKSSLNEFYKAMLTSRILVKMEKINILSRNLVKEVK